MARALATIGGGDFHARRTLRSQREKLVTSYQGSLMTGPASQSLGPDRASWAKLLFLSTVDQQDKMGLKRFTALMQHFGSELTEEDVIPTFAAACNGTTSLDWEGFCWWLGRVFCQESTDNFVDAIEELIHCNLMQSSMLLRVHLSGDAHGEAPQLVAAAPNTTVAQFEAMIAERISDEYRLTDVQVTSLKSMEGDLLQCGRDSTVKELVAEVGCALTANIVGGANAGLSEPSPQTPRSEAQGKIRPQLFGKPSIALQIYQRSHVDSTREDDTRPAMLLLSQQMFELRNGTVTAVVSHLLEGVVEAAVALEDCKAVAIRGQKQVQFLEDCNGETSRCAVPHPPRGLFSVWGGSIVALGDTGVLTLVHGREARQLAVLAGVDENSVSCSDGQLIYYIVYEPENVQHAVQLWQVGSDLQPTKVASAALPQPQAVVCHNGVVHIFASGLYKLSPDGEIQGVRVTGPDAFIIHSVAAAMSDSNSMFAISGASACEVWEISTDGACQFIAQAPNPVQAIIPAFEKVASTSSPHPSPPK